MRRPLGPGLALGAMLLLGDHAVAQPYRWVNANGVVHYADRPPQNPPSTVEDLETRRNTHDSTAGPVDPQSAAGLPVRENVARQSAMRESQAPRSAEAAGREVMELSGLDRRLDHLASLARLEFGHTRWEIEQPDSAWAVIAPFFGREALAATAGQLVTRHLDPAQTAVLLAWLRAPLARRIAQLQAEAAAPAQQATYRTFLSRLPLAPPSPRRLALLQRLDRAGSFTELEVERAQALRRAIARAVAPLRTTTRRSSDDHDTDRWLATDEFARFRLTAGGLFAYRSLSDADLERYALFVESATGRWFLRLHRETVLEALRVAQERSAAAVATASPPSRTSHRR